MAHHTCKQGTPGACIACDTETENFIYAQWHAGHLAELDDFVPLAEAAGQPRRQSDALDIRHTVDLDALYGDEIADYSSDPARILADPVDRQRWALRKCLHLAVVADVLADTARVARYVKNDDWRPNMTRADVKTTARLVRDVFDVISGPDYPQPESKPRHTPPTADRPERRTYAGPVVHTRANGRVSVYVQADIRHAPKDAPRWTETVRRPVPLKPQEALSLARLLVDPSNPDQAISPVRLLGTYWRKDAATTDADGFMAATASRGPVQRVNARKRRRDGSIGTSTIIR